MIICTKIENAIEIKNCVYKIGEEVKKLKENEIRKHGTNPIYREIDKSLKKIKDIITYESQTLKYDEDVTLKNFFNIDPYFLYSEKEEVKSKYTKDKKVDKYFEKLKRRKDIKIIIEEKDGIYKIPINLIMIKFAIKEEYEVIDFYKESIFEEKQPLYLYIKVKKEEKT